jgi:hypothetical protein
MLKAAPNSALGQQDGLGFSQVVVMDLQSTGAGIMPNDSVTLMAFGGPKNYPPIIGVRFPWDGQNPPFHSNLPTDAAGQLSLTVTVPTSAGGGPFGPEGLIIASATTYAGQPNPFGCSICAYQDAAPVDPPVPPVYSPQYLAQQYVAGVKLPNVFDPSQQVTVSFVEQVASWTGLVTIWGPECLNDAGTQQFATLIGGTPVKITPPSPFALTPVGPAPQVNGVRIILNGSPVVAVAGEISQALATVGAGATVAQVQAAILACFEPASA